MGRLAGKLFSAAIAAGTAVAVGYGLKKLEEKIQPQSRDDAPEEKEIIGTADSKITLKRGAGSEWSYTMTQKGVVKESDSTRDAAAQKFNFIPLKDGVTELEFDYKPQGKGASTQTITYNIEVKNGKIVRCDAAGDLQMVQKKSEQTSE